MAQLNLDPHALAATAASKAAQWVTQSLPPGLVQDVQRVLDIGRTIGRSGRAATNPAKAAGVENVATPLLGGLTLQQAQAIHARVRSARVALKNLFFVRLTEKRAPNIAYGTPARGGAKPGLDPLVSAVIGLAGGADLAKKIGLSGAGAAATPSVGATATASFDMLALDVRYGSALQAESVQIGSSFFDRPLGRSGTELAITTMDDEAGTLKRWFQAKLDQVALPDGSFGLPANYLVNIEVVHAIPSSDVPTAHLAYSRLMCLRPHSLQVEHSRKDESVAELALVFNQFDAFMGTP